MDKPSLSSRLQYFSLFIPFRFYLLLFVIGILLAKLWLSIQHTHVVSSFESILSLLTKILLTFGTALLILNLLTVLIPYIVFLFKVKSKNAQVEIDAALKEMEGTSKQLIKMKIHPILHPPFGFLRYRFVYDGHKLSPKFSTIDSKKNIRFFTNTQEGYYNWPLPEIKEYKIEKLVIYFEDLFQFFSFSIAIKSSDSFFTKPIQKHLDEFQLTPKKTEKENVRIEELRRVEGEYLNYKNFEDNDDVRRIVWKIYAKNKELVVRTPEILDPFASHIYLYASYMDGLSVSDKTIIAQKGLNYFKIVTWTVYTRLKQQGFDVRYIPDQEIKKLSTSKPEENIQYTISLSKWHNNGKIIDYVNPKAASVICISSLTSADQLTGLLDILPKDTSIVFIKLSNGFKKQNAIKWLKWIFLEEEKEADNRYLMQWNLSLDKRKMMQNEKNISKLLSKAEQNIITI